jgi:hypothetical protein
MNSKVLTTLGIATIAISLSACSASVSTGNNTNTAKPANNTAVVVNNNSNSTSSTNTSAAPAAGGDVVKIDEAGIQMTVPKGMKFSKDGEDTIVSTSDEGVAVRFSVPEDGDYEKAVADAAKQLDEYIKDVKVEEKATKKTVNGMEATSSSGTGKDEDGKSVNWDMTMLKTDKKPVLAIIYAEEASMQKHAADLKTFFDSVKKQ